MYFSVWCYRNTLYCDSYFPHAGTSRISDNIKAILCYTVLDIHTSSIASFTLLVLATTRLHDSTFEHKKRVAQNNKILDLTPKQVNKINLRNGKYNLISTKSVRKKAK